MPDYAGTYKAAARGQIGLSNTILISNAHSATRDRVAEIRSMEMTLMSYARLERAAENSLVGVFVQQLANRGAVPSSSQRVRERRCCRARGEHGYDQKKRNRITAGVAAPTGAINAAQGQSVRPSNSSGKYS